MHLLIREELVGFWSWYWCVYVQLWMILPGITRQSMRNLLCKSLVRPSKFSLSGRWYLVMILICIFLMITDVEHFFMYLLAKWLSSLMKCLSTFLLTFKKITDTLTIIHITYNLIFCSLFTLGFSFYWFIAFKM